ncbi:MurR/RpiR family transcriptional regulator [Labrys neptuniae]
MSTTKKEDRDQVPQNYEGFVNVITIKYEQLSDGFQQIARFFTQNPNVIALESINAIAAKCGAHPSSLVRFAQNFGYSGFKQLQEVFRKRLATAAPGFQERLGALETELTKNQDHGNLGHLKDLVIRDIATLHGLLEDVTEEQLTRAAKLIIAAKTVYIAGQLRSEPIAIFLRYLLTMLHRRVILLDPAGGLAQEMAVMMTSEDVLLPIAFRHYAKEVVAITDIASAGGVPIVAITDSQLSPLAKDASVLFTVPEDEYSFSRSLAAPMCLIQCIAISVAATLQPGTARAPRIPTVTGIERDRSAAGVGAGKANVKPPEA